MYLFDRWLGVKGVMKMFPGIRTDRSGWMIIVMSALLLVGCRSGTRESTSGGSTSGDTATISTGSPEQVPPKGEVVTWSIEGSKLFSAPPGGVINLRLRAVVAPGVRLYTDREYGGLDFAPVPTTIELTPQSIFAGAGDMVADQGSVNKIDPHFGDQQMEYWIDTVTITVPITLSRNAVAGTTYDASVQIEFMSCTDKSCHTPKTATLPITIRITGG
jgi:hypothetical protein